MKFKLPTQEELNARCEEAIKKYLVMDPRAAKVEFVIQMQGWIGAETANGKRIDESLIKIVEIATQIGAAQIDPDPERESKTLRDLYEKRGKQ